MPSSSKDISPKTRTCDVTTTRSYEVVSELWRWVKEDFKIGPLEHLDLDTLSPFPVTNDSIAIRVCYWRQARPNDYGKDSIKDYRTHTEEIPLRYIDSAMRKHRGAVIDLIWPALRYAAICVLPFRKPKGYKILHRRSVLSPAPKLRWPRLVARSSRPQARRP